MDELLVGVSTEGSGDRVTLRLQVEEVVPGNNVFRVSLSPQGARCYARMLLEAADMADPPGFKIQGGVEADE
jgi:hypothetical protein